MRIEQHLRKAAEDHPHLDAIKVLKDHQWQQLTYQKLWQCIDKTSDQFQTYHIACGERVVLILHNSIGAVVTLLALLHQKATVIMISPELEEEELLHQLKVADVRIVITDAAPIYQKLIRYNIPVSGLLKEEQCYFKCCSTVPQVSIGADRNPDIAMMLFTSGTTGESKAVMLSHSNFLYLIKQLTFEVKAQPADVCLTVLPIFHVACVLTSIFVPLASGACIVFLARLSQWTLSLAMKTTHPQFITVVPRFLEWMNESIEEKLARSPKWKQRLFSFFCRLNFCLRRALKVNLGRFLFLNLHREFGSQLREILSGGAHLSINLRQRFYALGFHVRSAYGLTETTGTITMSDPDKGSDFSSVGLGFPKAHWEIEKPDEKGIGEIVYSGPAMMQGYFRNPKATSQLIVQNRLFTGDLGYLTANKTLVIQGRKKELIVFSDGKKALSEQIEARYKGISGMQDFAVVALQKTPQERLIAVMAVVMHPDAPSAKVVANIYRRASKLQSPYRIEKVYIVDSIPCTPTQKIKRNELAVKLASLSAEKSPLRPDALNSINVALLKLFSENTPIINIDTTFAELGIDSLKAIDYTEKINHHFHLKLKPTVFFQYQTIGELAHSINPLEKPSLPNPRYRLGTASRVTTHNDIAVVALNCRFPGHANHPSQYWYNLCAGQDGIVEVPSNRFSIDDYYDPDMSVAGKINTRFGGFVDGLDTLDVRQFGIKPRVAKAMDPQQKLVTVHAADLLKQAHFDLSKWRGSRCGVFIGVSSNDFFIHLIKNTPVEKINPYMGTGMTVSAIAGRVSYELGLHGPSLVVDCACSSSLVAIHQAVRALQNGDCDSAMAGGVSVLLEPEMSIVMSKAGMLSPDGRCKTFDENANGYVRSEGCGLVLLKRYEQAMQDNDKILAVIKGSFVNQDGHSNGFNAPNGQAQQDCFRQALAIAQLDPLSVSYIETHGSGTKLGDPIEVESIQSIYAPSCRTSDNPLILGAVKSNIGHAEAAAGIAGFIKTVLVLHHQKIPPNLHLKRLNPHIHALSDELIFPTTLNDGHIDYAAVNSFGFTGTNAHVVLAKHLDEQ